MAVPVQLEIFMKDLTKAGLQSVGKNVDDVENQTLKLISALKQVIAEQKKQLEVNKIAGISYTQEAANIQALTGQVRGLEAGLKNLKKTKEETAKTQAIDIDTEAVTRKTNNLKMQFSQVARELPSLAMGPQMFILAISNNLPMLADAIADVRKQNELLAASGQKSVPVWKQLASAVFSWQTALVAAISLGIVYGKEIGNWVSSLFKAKEETLSLADAQKKVNKEFQSADSDIGKQIVIVNSLSDRWKSLGDNLDTKKKFIRDNRVELDKLGVAVENVNDAENLLAKGTSSYIEAMSLRAQAAAAFKLAEEQAEKAVKKRVDADKEEKKGVSWKDKIKSYFISSIMAAEGAGNFDDAPKPEDYFKDRINGLREEQKVAEESAKTLTDIYSDLQQKADKILVKNGIKQSKDPKQKTDYTSQLEDARVRAQQTTEKLRLQIMVEGIAKRKALARQEYDEQLADIDRQERDTTAKMDKARKQGDNIPQSQYDAVRQKAQEQRILAQQLYNDQLLQIDKEYNDKVTQSFIDYNKQYGTYQEKRLAIAMDYARKIAAAETEGDEYKKKALEQERKESLSALDFSELKDSIDWEVVFGNLSKVSKQELQKVKLQLKQFKQSPEYKNMTVEQQKIVNEAISSIQENIIGQGGILGDLPEQLKELASAQNELEAAQKEYNDALANGTEVEIEAARKKKTQATQNVINSQSNVNLSAEKAQSNISTVIDSISNLGEAEASLSSFGNSIGTLIDVFSESEHKIGGIIGAILGLLDQLGQKGIMGVADGILSNVWNLAGHMWDTIGSLFGVKGLGGIFYGADYSEYDNMKNQYETLIDIWDSLISKKQQYIDISYGKEAEKAYQESVSLLDQKMRQAYALAEARKSAGKSLGSHSIAYRQNRDLGGYASELYKYVNQNGNYNDVTNALLGASAEQLRNVRDNMWAFWSGLDSGFRDALEQIIACDDQMEELNDRMNEAKTGVDFSSFQNGFADMLKDLDSTSQDFADNFEKYLQNAVFSSLVADRYKSGIEALYKDWTAKAESGLTKDEAGKLRQDYQDIINDMLAEREKIMKDFGWTSSADSGSSQSPGSGALTTMSQDSISTFEGIGRNMQTHLANTDKFVQEIRNTQRQDSQTLATIAGHTAHLVEIHEILSDMKLNGITLK